jgi:hypothetical protein
VQGRAQFRKPEMSDRERHCLAGHVRLELRNVVANYPFESSHRFPGIQPNSGHRDYSRLSCGKRSSGLVADFLARVLVIAEGEAHGRRSTACTVTVGAFGGALPPTTPSIDFCAAVRSPRDDLSLEGQSADLPR